MNKILTRCTCGRFRSNLNKIRSLMAGENGLALPLALAILALGALIIGPFLAHASAGAVSSASYGQRIKENSAAEAGIEKAIWDLTYGTLESQIPDLDDSVNYQVTREVNDLIPDITVTHTQSGGGGQQGEPAGTITDTGHAFQFSTPGTRPDTVRVSENILAVVYSDTSNHGILQTVSISSTGEITSPRYFAFDPDNTCYEPGIINIAGNIFAIVYRDSREKGHLVTVDVPETGIITQKDTSPFGSGKSYEQAIVKAFGNYYIIASRGPSNKGYLYSVTIEDNGTISNAYAAFGELPTDVYTPSFVHISNNVSGLVYTDASNRGYVATLEIADNGQITHSTPVEFSSIAFRPVITHVSGITYVIAYRGQSSSLRLVTLSISFSGNISSPVPPSVSPNNGYEPDIIAISGQVIAVAYQDPGTKGYLKTFQIASTGEINTSPLGILQFEESASAYEPVIKPMAAGIYAIAYRDNSNHVFVKIVGIATDAGTGIGDTYRVQSIAGGSTITAVIEVGGASATIQSWLLSR